MFNLFLKFILIFKDIFKPIILFCGITSFYLLKKLLLLHYEIFYFLAFEIFVKLSFVEMPSKLLGVLPKFILTFFYLANKRKKRVIIFLFVELLIKEWDYISTGLLFDLYYNIKHFFFLSRTKGNLDRLNRYQ